MNRIEQLQMRMRKEKIDICLISDSKAIDYFINQRFHSGERLIALIVEKNCKPCLYLNKLIPCNLNEYFDLVRISDTDNAICMLAKKCNGKHVAIDKMWPSHFLLELMQETSQATFTTAILVDSLRSIKSEEEKEKMRRASLNNDKVMAKVRELIQLGKSEKQLENEIRLLFKEIADSDPSFETIVAYQENCADPHAVPSDKILEEGMSVIVDMGCVYEGYCSDMTRTFFVNKNPIQEIYDTVLQANLAGIAAIKPGAKFSDVDRAARRVIEDAGYGEYFIHRLGHGIGLEVHEPFDVSAVNNTLIEEGMCFSIEPGIYIEGKYGVRIEDLVLVTKDGCEVLNHDSKTDEVLIRK